MPGGISNYLADKINDGMHGGTNYTQPATTYFALMTVMPTGSGGGTEVSGGSYARVAFTNNSTNWPASSGQTKTNATIIDFGTATAAWGTIVGVAEYDASSSGNLLSFGPLTATRVVGSGDSFQIPAGGATYTAA
jgi:hypothetical protein